MSIWEKVKSWFGMNSSKITLDTVLNHSTEISETDLTEILNKARAGDVENELFAGVLYLKGVRVPQDPLKAVEFLEKSAQTSNLDAQKILAKEYMSGVRIPQNLKQSFEWFQKAAYRGDVESMHNLGLMYEEGQVVEKDIYKAIECFQKAADLGYTEAKVEIADIYYEGVDLPMDRMRACEMYKEILAGDTSTIDVARIYMCLGQAYADKFFPCGLGEEEGFVFLKKAIEKEYFEAVRIFALLGEELDEGYRRWLFEFSAQHQDNPYCDFAMGICYENGYGTFKDINSAFNYYKKSADLGDPWGMHYVAEMYLKGQGVEKSLDEWLRLETQAAEKGVPPAQYNIGMFYLKESRTDQNLEKARRFLKSAADNHYDDAVKALKEMPSFWAQEENVPSQGDAQTQQIQPDEQKPEVQRTVQPSEQTPELPKVMQNFETQQPVILPQEDIQTQPTQQIQSDGRKSEIQMSVQPSEQKPELPEEFHI